jgi:hypothetical protein
MRRGAALMLTLTLLVAGCSWNGSTRPTSYGHTRSASQYALASWESKSGGLELRYPASWHHYDWQKPAMPFGFTLVYLGTDREHAPCKTTHRKGMTVIRCHSPINKLSHGGVLVTWGGGGRPVADGTPPLAGVPGKLVHLPSGWLEKISIGDGGDCPGLDATRNIDAAFARPSSSWAGRSISMTACLRGPLLASHTRQVLSMVRSAGFVASP